MLALFASKHHAADESLVVVAKVVRVTVILVVCDTDR
jgi:hypothetical protein